MVWRWKTRNRPVRRNWTIVFMRAASSCMRTVYDLNINKGAHCFHVQWWWWDASKYKAPLPFGPLVISGTITFWLGLIPRANLDGAVSLWCTEASRTANRMQSLSAFDHFLQFFDKKWLRCRAFWFTLSTCSNFTHFEAYIKPKSIPLVWNCECVVLVLVLPMYGFKSKCAHTSSTKENKFSFFQKAK